TLVQRKLLSEGPYYPLFQPAQVILYSSNVTNVTYSPTTFVDIRSIGHKSPGGFRRAAVRLRRRPTGSFGWFVLQRALSFVFLTIGITLVAFLLTHLVP